MLRSGLRAAPAVAETNGMNSPHDPGGASIDSTVALDRLMSVTVDPDGIVHLRWAPGTTITEEAARRSVEVVAQVSGGRRLPLLVDIDGIRGLAREARAVYAEVTSIAALALVGQKPMVRVFANFSLSVTRPTVPSRFVADEDEAVRWLRGYSP